MKALILVLLLIVIGCASDFSFVHTDPEGKTTKIVKEGDCLDTQIFDHKGKVCHDKLSPDR